MRTRSKFELLDLQLHDPAQGWQTLWRSGQRDLPLVSHPSIRVPTLDAKQPVTLNFRTPFRYVQHDRVVKPSELRLHHVYRALLRRIAMLNYFYQQRDLSLDFGALIDDAESVPLQSSRLQWVPWKRYSARQKAVIPLNGVRGELVFSLKDHEALWPVLWLGQWAHGGKATVMGLGEYTLKNHA